VIVCVFGRGIVSLMISGDAQKILQVLDYAQNQLYVMAAALPGLYLLVLYRSALTGMDRPMQAMLSGFLELIVSVAAVMILPPVIGEWGIYLALALGWPVAALQLYICYMLAYRKCTRDPVPR